MQPRRHEQLLKVPATVHQLPVVQDERGTHIERERHSKAQKLIDLADGIIAEHEKGKKQGNGFATSKIETAVQHLKMAREHISQITNAGLQVPTVVDIFDRFKKLHNRGYLKNLNTARNTADLALNPDTTKRLRASIKSKK
ncbi:MAG: hypothetical protein AAB573_03550 [Patescibacteria group bacterium]